MGDTEMRNTGRVYGAPGCGVCSYFRAQELLSQGDSYLDGSRDGDACETEL